MDLDWRGESPSVLPQLKRRPKKTYHLIYTLVNLPQINPPEHCDNMWMGVTQPYVNTSFMQSEFTAGQGREKQFRNMFFTGNGKTLCLRHWERLLEVLPGHSQNIWYNQSATRRSITHTELFRGHWVTPETIAGLANVITPGAALCCLNMIDLLWQGDLVCFSYLKIKMDFCIWVSQCYQSLNKIKLWRWLNYYFISESFLQWSHSA